MSVQYRVTLSLAVALFLGAVTPCFGASEKEVLQKIDKIKNNPKYYCGEGQDKDASKARERAKSHLADNIEVSIRSSFDVWAEELRTQHGSYSSELVKETTHSFSSVYLRGLREYTYKKGKEHIVFTYIDRNSVQKCLELRKGKIRELVQHGERLELSHSIGPSLRNYYWAYLLSVTYPDTIHYRFRGEDLTTTYMPAALSNHIQSVIRDIVVTADGECIYEDISALMIPLDFSYHEKPINDLSFSYYSGSAMDYNKVPAGGSIEIPLFNFPSDSCFTLVLNIEYRYASAMSQVPEVAEVDQFLGEIQFSNQKTLQIDLSGGETVAPPSPVIKSLMALTGTQELLEQLRRYKASGDIAIGRRDNFWPLEGCYVIVVDEQRAVGYLQFVRSMFYDLRSKKRYLSLSGEFSGKREIWIRDFSALGN